MPTGRWRVEHDGSWRGALMRVMYAYPGGGSRFPYLILQDADGPYYKVRIQNRFLFVSQGTDLIERQPGEVDIPHVGANRTPVGDFVYASATEALAALARVRSAPGPALAMVLAGQKP